MRYLRKTKKILLFIIIFTILLTSCGCTTQTEDMNNDDATEITTSDKYLTDENTTSAQLTVSKEDEFTANPRSEDPNTMAIGSYEGNANIVNIPAEAKGMPITEVAGHILRCNQNVVKINVPDSVTEIVGNAFQFCPNLRKFDMGDGVTTIGENLCLGDTALKELKLSDSLTEISRGAFLDCASLETVIVPDKVASIKYASFSGCTSLKEVHMTDSVTYIEDEEDVEPSVFEGCESLTIYAPSGSYAESYAKKKNIPFVAE